MPKTSQKDSSPDESDVPFEDALAQLEELVRDMESDQMPLEALIKNYEKGTQLFQVCEKRLDEAEGRIEIIRKKRNGEAVVEAFGDASSETESEESDTDAADTSPSDSESVEEESSDNGELF